ncbi:hypothetical protein [Nocardia cyriacigeorgica]|nr:hypothetical protein [Nocardia cyriacigeorgica]
MAATSGLAGNSEPEGEGGGAQHRISARRVAHSESAPAPPRRARLWE